MGEQHCIRTFTGKLVDLSRPDPELIDIEDIAHSLSMTCRFGGHVRDFYSVAEHSWHAELEGMTRGMSSAQRMTLLLHDAAEAYFGDATRPLKALLPDYRRLEQACLDVILAKYGAATDELTLRLVHEIDDQLLAAEQVNLCVGEEVSATVPEWFLFTFEPSCCGPAEARRHFLHRFRQLQHGISRGA